MPQATENVGHDLERTKCKQPKNNFHTCTHIHTYVCICYLLCWCEQDSNRMLGELFHVKLIKKKSILWPVDDRDRCPCGPARLAEIIRNFLVRLKIESEFQIGKRAKRDREKLQS